MKDMKIITKFNAFLTRYEKTSGLLFFALGFAWDWFTIGRIDSISEIAFLVAYFVLLSVSVYLSYTHHTYDSLKKYESYLQKYLPVATQFFLGGLTSSFVVFFYRSVSLSRTATFLIIITLILITNEFFRKRITAKVLFVHFSFVSFVFFGCITPLMFSLIGSKTFYISGILSLVLLSLIRVFISLRVNKDIKRKLKGTFYSIVLTHIVIILLFIFKLIPPVPLALKHGLVAYDVNKIDGKYQVTYKPTEWYKIWKKNENELKFKDQDTIFVFTSIFSPKAINKKVFHKWSHYDKKLEEWNMTDHIGYLIQGGRSNGYRAYTYKTNIVEGDWKVEVTTDEDIIIGVLYFTINLHDEERPQKLKTKYF